MPGGDREIIDIAALERAGVLSLLELADDELDQFISFAREIDDDEASTFAVATSRGVRVATDDRRAQRLADALDPRIAVVTTTDLIRTWIDGYGATAQQVAEVVRSVERRASYVPRRDDPNCEW